MSQTRRLAAILATDVADYSRLIGAGEGRPIAAVRASKRLNFRPMAQRRHRPQKSGMAGFHPLRTLDGFPGCR
jgi:hypothetical protein